MTKAGFGEHLKREREMRGVSLDEICAATRISTRFLEALESEQWEQLPGGVFNRGFVRAVARFLGLDEEGFVAEYALALNENGAPPTWTNQSVKPPDNLSWLPWAALGALLIIVAGVGWFGWHRYESHRVQRAAAQHAAAEALSPAPSAIAPAVAAGVSASTDISPATAAPPAENAGSAGNAAPVTTSPAIADGALQLKIEAGKATTVNVSADGKKVFEGRFTAGQNRTFTARTNFDVTARDGGALLLELNGHTLAPMGPPGRPGKVTLTRHDASAPSGGFN